MLAGLRQRWRNSTWRRALDRRGAAWVRRRQGPDVGAIEVHRRRLYILPTRAGLGFGVLLFGMLLAGLNYGNSLALMTTFLLGGFVLVGLNQVHRNLLGLRVLQWQTRPAFAGSDAMLELRVENPASTARHGLEIEIAELQGADGSRARLEIPVIPGGGGCDLRVPLPTRRRGRLQIARVRLSTRFPFGFFRAWTWLHPDVDVLVYPAARGVLPPPAAAGARESGQSLALAGHDEWTALRSFREGDSPRQVAWKAYARGQPLLVKEYRGATADGLRLDFDALAPLDVERRLQQLARWVEDAEARGQRYALHTPEGGEPEGLGAGHRRRCLERLALYGLGNDAR